MRSSSSNSSDPPGDARQGDAQARAREGAPVRYRARVEYDGTDFAGFQAQPGTRTVQGELETALARLSGGVRVRVDGAGRTDAGVHATGQVIAFTYRGALPAGRLVAALNGMLPRDIAIGDLRVAPTGFHPRFAARYREYRYSIWNGPRSPLRERHAFGVRDLLDETAMAEAGAVLVGRHDFSAFGRSVDQPVRTVFAVRVRRAGRLVTIDIRANAFLQGMVRRIVAVLVEVGRGRLTDAAVAAMLTGGAPALNGAMVPARGLCLRRVTMGRRERKTTDGDD